MTSEEFEKRAATLTQEALSLMKHIKGPEYANETSDRLSNFKEAAALQHITPAMALVGMWAKHIVSLVDLIRTHRTNDLKFHEKLVDAINYLILLEALVSEEA
jgi:hypothetical protein